jgi:dTMP kinase
MTYCSIILGLGNLQEKEFWSATLSESANLKDSGLFFSFEGVEGSGKSTQVKLLAEYLEAKGYEVVLTREPGGSPISDEIRKILLTSSTDGISPKAELLLFLASRAEHVEKIIRPALEKGKVVITDRYTDSSLAYQGEARSLTMEDVSKLNDFATSNLYPDLTFLLDLDPENGLKRSLDRLNREGSDESRMEEEDQSFHEKTREAFLKIAKLDPDRFCVLDASETPEDIFEKIKDYLSSPLERLNGGL